MEIWNYLLVILVAFGASMLTFFSGFGLGTMLTPVFILFFPPEIAVAATAIVHFLNNMFKLVLVGKHAVKNIVLGFGLPAVAGAYVGASLLGWLANLDLGDLVQLFGSFETSALNITLGALIISFSLLELLPAFKRLEFEKKWLIPGGIISGLFGGISGHQGALRSAFLIKFPLTKEQFVASGIVIACLVDTIRIGTYSATFDFSTIADSYVLLISATLAAFSGALLGKRMMKKVTIDSIQNLVAILMTVIGALLLLGVI